MGRRCLRLLGGLGLLLSLLLIGPLWLLASGQVSGGGHWSAASRVPEGLAPTPHEAPGAVVQVYAARAWGWRGAFGVHTWLATRRPGAETYRMHHVLSWRHPALVSQSTVSPDRAWYGNAPVLLADYRGRSAEAMIGAIEAAVAAYPLPGAYYAWPGPNSNTFTAWVTRAVPGLEVVLPVTAVGKDYLPGTVLASAPGGAGMTLSLGGLLGMTLARDEGLELNLLGLAWGLDVRRPALKLPGIGRLGMPPVIKGHDGETRGR
ncbi:DUF3750 domain-containing protein [Halomonas cerina]|uniref:DUF3750 domain-containing protein n=1 Tax=Halomonas cerina TaxID=447424 RepID=A0A839VB57_9GAMM|nr:DUF3750 domain-containing protein [Halomonas cerina]MBB3191210.1 hypothetical protein [Halomonas cerina]